MSESDESDILADIHALEEALSITTKDTTQKSVRRSDSRSDLFLTNADVEDDDDDYFNYLDTNQDIDDSLNAYDINTKLITGLTIAKKKLTALLQQCEEKIKQLDEKMLNSTDNLNSCRKLAISHAGMPYFKDKNYFFAPKNYDVKLKEARGELCLLSIKKPSRWSGRDRETLLKAIHDQAMESVLLEGFNKKIDKNFADKMLNDQTEKTTLVLPRNFNEMVGAIGSREFDWLKISAVDFDNKHSPGECRSMWNVYLHPDIRKTEWTNSEDNKLLMYAKECKYQDWDTITQKLGTNRSAYQCFIRFNTIKKMPSCGRPWTKQEDRLLIKVINRLKIGNYIPWAEIANYLRHRTKQQIYTRWMYRKAPHLRKGRFTFVETDTLLKAVQKYGTDFSKISNVVMPHRTSIQLSERYKTIIKKGENIWTINDDMKLIHLQKKHGNDWSKLATYFSGKSRTQVRHRYNAIIKYVTKGHSLESMPRLSASTNKKSSKNTSEYCNAALKKLIYPIIEINDIQSRLYETLCFPLSMKTTNPQELDIKQLECDTKKLYNTLKLLDANLNITTLLDNFLNYVHLNRRDKQLLISLKKYVDIKNNKTHNYDLIEKFEMQMFNCIPKVSESSRFIPPLPFGGYMRTKKIKTKNKSIDYDSNHNEKFLIDIPTESSIVSCLGSLISTEEEIQFQKLSQFLINNYHNWDKQNIETFKLLECNFSFDTRSPSRRTSEYNQLNADSRLYAGYKQIELFDKLEETYNIEHTNEDDEEVYIWNNIIQPNQATLLGYKNLLVWKLLYEYQNESNHCESISSLTNKLEPEQVEITYPIQTESAEYQLLRTRLLQLFKFPIGLSNTILQIRRPDTIFLEKMERDHQIVSIKRKSEDIDRMQSNKKSRYNILTDDNFNFNPNIDTKDFSTVVLK